jgi:hypothetical protein
MPRNLLSSSAWGLILTPEQLKCYNLYPKAKTVDVAQIYVLLVENWGQITSIFENLLY